MKLDASTHLVAFHCFRYARQQKKGYVRLLKNRKNYKNERNLTGNMADSTTKYSNTCIDTCSVLDVVGKTREVGDER